MFIEIRFISTIEFRFVFDKPTNNETLSMAGWGIGKDQTCLTMEGGPSPYHPCKVNSSKEDLIVKKT